MKHRASIYWKQENVFIGLFAICLGLLSFFVMQGDEKRNFDTSVDSIQVFSYPPSIVAGAKYQRLNALVADL